MSIVREQQQAPREAAGQVRHRVLVCDAISQAGIDALAERFEVTVTPGWDREELLRQVAGYDAVIVRSATRLDAEVIEAATRLRVIGRAGVGVDNIDLQAASRQGVVVVNAPTSTVVSAAEHTVGLIFALMRNIPRADASMRRGEWDRKSFLGAELAGSRIAILGFGRIGQIVGERARSLGMQVTAYDPFVSSARFEDAGVERAQAIPDAVAEADIVTLHLPLTDDTREVIDADLLAALQPGTRIINAARGPLVDLDAVHAALETGQLGGFACDVYPVEPPPSHPLFQHERVVLTPHIAASTREAQDRAGIDVAHQVAAALAGGSVTTAVNVPMIASADIEALQGFRPLTAMLARLAFGLAGGNVRSIRVEARGRIAEHDVRLLTSDALISILSASSDDPVNHVNAGAIAESRGIVVHEEADRNAGSYHDLVTVTCSGEREVRVSGTTIGQRYRPWLVSLLGFDIDLELGSELVVLEYDDVPGMVGAIGSAFGEAGVNIAKLAVSRSGDDALMLLTLDGDCPPELLGELATRDGFRRTAMLQLRD